AHLAGFLRLPVTGLGGAVEAPRRRAAADPVRGFAPQPGRNEIGAVAALVNHQHVARHILADHVPGRGVETAHAADLQAFALAQGEVEHAGVAAHHAAVGGADLALAGGQVAREEAAEVALADEADAGGVLFRGGRQGGVARDAAHFALGQPAQREHGGGQLRLAQLVKEVALVLAAVGGAQQLPAVARLRHARVVAGGDVAGAELARRVEEMPELDLAVAQHVRVGRAPGGVLGHEVLEHAAPVLGREIAEVDRDPQPTADRDRVAAVLFGPAGSAGGRVGRRAGVGTAARAGLVAPVLHEQAGDGAARI